MLVVFHTETQLGRFIIIGRKTSGETAPHADTGVEIAAYTQPPHAALFVVRSHASPTTRRAN